MDSAQLVLGDPVRPPEIVGQRALGWIILAALAQVPKYIVDFFLR